MLFILSKENIFTSLKLPTMRHGAPSFCDSKLSTFAGCRSPNHVKASFFARKSVKLEQILVFLLKNKCKKLKMPSKTAKKGKQKKTSPKSKFFNKFPVETTFHLDLVKVLEVFLVIDQMTVVYFFHC